MEWCRSEQDFISHTVTHYSTYNKDAVFPQYLPVHSKTSYLRSKKASSFWGSFAPKLPNHGLCPWTPLRAQHPRPHHLLPILAISFKPRVCV